MAQALITVYFIPGYKYQSNFAYDVQRASKCWSAAFGISFGLRTKPIAIPTSKFLVGGKLPLSGADPTKEIALPWMPPFIDKDGEITPQAVALLEQAPPDGSIPVFYVPDILSETAEAGLGCGFDDWPPFIFMSDARNYSAFGKNPHRGALEHELGHAACLDHNAMHGYLMFGFKDGAPVGSKVTSDDLTGVAKSYIARRMAR